MCVVYIQTTVLYPNLCRLCETQNGCKCMHHTMCPRSNGDYDLGSVFSVCHTLMVLVHEKTFCLSKKKVCKYMKVTALTLNHVSAPSKTLTHEKISGCCICPSP